MFNVNLCKCKLVKYKHVRRPKLNSLHRLGETFLLPNQIFQRSTALNKETTLYDRTE